MFFKICQKGLFSILNFIDILSGHYPLIATVPLFRNTFLTSLGVAKRGTSGVYQNYKSDESCANDIEVHCFNNGNCGVFCQDGGAPIGVKSFQCVSTGKKKKQGWTSSRKFSSEFRILSHDSL